MRRASPPVTEVNAWSAPVQEKTSSSTSGRSTRGSITFTADRNATSKAGSASDSSAAKCSHPSSPAVICAFAGSLPTTSR
ncbi:hypothetical protein AB0O31_09900 [Kitasatospora cineracea]|uniref:hypothetical protein n=1 Tax=Kitasatospora cineracea TaxID=88074 RepID=UPI00342976C6